MNRLISKTFFVTLSLLNAWAVFPLQAQAVQEAQPVAEGDPSESSFGGSDAGNGGTGIILRDGSAVLADAYLVKPETCISAQSFPDQLKQTLRGAEALLRYQGLWRSWENEPSSKPFFESHVFSRSVDYCFVDTFPDFCQPEDGSTYSLPDGSTVIQAGCTDPKQPERTYLSADFTRRASVRELAKLVIHERLHAFTSDKDHKADHIQIAGITDAVEALLSLRERQEKGELTLLTDKEFLSISRAPMLIAQLGLYRLESYGKPVEDPKASMLEHFKDMVVARLGGGWVAGDIDLDPTAYVDLTSHVPAAGGRIGAGALIENSSVIWMSFDSDQDARRKFIMGAGSRLRSTRVYVTDWGTPTNSTNVSAHDSGFHPIYNVVIGKGTLVDKSYISGSLALGDQVRHIESFTNRMTIMSNRSSTIKGDFINGLIAKPGSMVRNSKSRVLTYLDKDAQLVRTEIENPYYFDYWKSNLPRHILRAGAKVVDSKITIRPHGFDYKTKPTLDFGPGSTTIRSVFDFNETGPIIQYGHCNGIKATNPSELKKRCPMKKK